MLRTVVALVFITFSANPASGAEQDSSRRIQIAILLDNSGSMSGLINQARSELWTLVNQFTNARVNGKRPTLEVALYSYGSPPGQMLVPLTTDLDRVSEVLFSLGISGGSEYCGTVIAGAVEQLEWSRRKDDLKMIFIAGNEPFTQGSIPYRQAIAQAKENGISVNPIHCGDERAAEAGEWTAAATLAGATLVNINHDTAVAHISTPYDARIAELGAKLNRTYIPWGARGREGQARQQAQDANASKISSQVATQRALAKASVNYRNDGWCLADAYRSGNVDLETLEPEELPADMRAMTLAEKKAHIEKLLAEREAIQKEISEINSKRVAFVAKAREKMAAESESTLDTAMTKSVHTRAVASGFDL
jgi:hypothetical protein